MIGFYHGYLLQLSLTLTSCLGNIKVGIAEGPRVLSLWCIEGALRTKKMNFLNFPISASRCPYLLVGVILSAKEKEVSLCLSSSALHSSKDPESRF